MTVHVISSAGALVYFDAGDTNRQALLGRLQQLGLDKFCPAERSPTQALQIALNEHKKSTRRELRAGAKHGDKSKLDVAVQALADRQANGFEVLGIERGEQINVYSGRFSVKLDEQEQVVVTSGALTLDNQQALQRQFAAARATLGADSVGPSLIEIAKHLGGTTLREAGGIYYVPEQALPVWEQVMAAFQESGGSRVYCVRTVMDTQTVRAVKDAIVSEVCSKAGELTDEITSGSLGPTAIENRKAKALALHARVHEYEGILSETLGHLHAVIQVAEQAAAAALAIQEDSAIGVFA